jgi:hypothetical protein
LGVLEAIGRLEFEIFAGTQAMLARGPKPPLAVSTNRPWDAQKGEIALPASPSPIQPNGFISK